MILAKRWSKEQLRRGRRRTSQYARVIGAVIDDVVEQVKTQVENASGALCSSMDMWHKIKEGPFVTVESMDAPWWLYLARGHDGALYTGISTDPWRRIDQHNSGVGSKWCRAHRPLELVFVYPCESHGDALRLEADIKRWTKKQKEELCIGY